MPLTPELEYFLRIAATRGLHATDALRLAIERALVLIDGDALLVDRGAARRLLCAAAARTSVHRSLAPDRAAYVRQLTAARPLAACELPDMLTVELPQELVARARGVVPASALREEAIEEMVAWELAATLDGRPMAEWALLALAARKQALAC